MKVWINQLITHYSLVFIQQILWYYRMHKNFQSVQPFMNFMVSLLSTKLAVPMATD